MENYVKSVFVFALSCSGPQTTHAQRIPRYLLPALTKEMSEKTSAMLEPVMFLAVLTFVE